MNNKSIQILRGSATHDPLTSTETLADGQPFYSKKDRLLYIGEKDSSGTEQSIKDLKPVSSNLQAGSGKYSTQQKLDGTTGTFDFTNKNPNATALDSTLTGDIQYGGVGAFSTTFGGKASAQGKRSFAAGTTTIAKGAYSAAFGDNSVALGNDSFTEGAVNVSKGYASHSEGNTTQAIGDNSHSEGNETQATALNSHAEGYKTISAGQGSHAEGSETVSTGTASHAEGDTTNAFGHHSHSEGYLTQAIGENAHAEGYNTKAKGENSHTEGYGTLVLLSIPSSGESGSGGTSSGTTTSGEMPFGQCCHAEGWGTAAIGFSSHAEGNGTSAQGHISHAEGFNSITKGYYSHAEGQGNLASGVSSHAEGNDCTAEGDYSHAEGGSTTASGDYSHAEGYKTIAKSYASHAGGVSCTTQGIASMTMGLSCSAYSNYSQAFGLGTTSNKEGQFVCGTYNDTRDSTSMFVVGGGLTSDAKNLFWVNNNGAYAYSSDTSSDYACVTRGSILYAMKTFSKFGILVTRDPYTYTSSDSSYVVNVTLVYYYVDGVHAESYKTIDYLATFTIGLYSTVTLNRTFKRTFSIPIWINKDADTYEIKKNTVNFLPDVSIGTGRNVSITLSGTVSVTPGGYSDQSIAGVTASVHFTDVVFHNGLLYVPNSIIWKDSNEVVKFSALQNLLTYGFTADVICKTGGQPATYHDGNLLDFTFPLSNKIDCLGLS